MGRFQKIFTALTLTFTLISFSHAGEVVRPSKMDQADIEGKIFQRPNMEKETKNGRTFLDTVTLLSQDKKFVTGMYQAGPGRFEIKDKDYGVDEFMYFTKGSVTLTSLDGSVQTIKAGEAVSLPKEWRGIWETKGYTKIYVIYSPTGDLD